jgi:hippurate hydrolase
MPIVNRIAEFHDEITKWRRHIHSNPELMYDVHGTAEFVVERLKSFGVDEVIEGIGRTGVVGLIRGRDADKGRCIGLRADMDALPIFEKSGKAYASQVEGKMHACGHDGHTAMLLGAAKYLAETRNFTGSVAVIFQPAEEGGAGGKAMVDDGMMERFGIDEVYGMHNMPGLKPNEFAIRKGAFMAATDEFKVTIHGLGAHAAYPHLGVDPIYIGSLMVQALQGIVSRNTDPLKSAVVTVTGFNAGTGAQNIIPQTAEFIGTVRTLDKEVRTQTELRFKEVLEGIAAAYGAKVEIHFANNYPVVINHDEQTEFAIKIASEIVGADNVATNYPPSMGGEDFAYMLEARPGAFILVGNGDSAGLHHEEYDFNDEAIPMGSSYWVKLVETALS